MTADYGTISGGYENIVGGSVATVGGERTATPRVGIGRLSGGWQQQHRECILVDCRSVGNDNTASADWSTVGGGNSNSASGNRSTVGGGNSNTASASWSTVGGGDANTASGKEATVSAAGI